ncbi:MAG: DUF615 domain-containing protein [Xanthomonadales bacterium]|nr:DUF615 domain-containing protein [Xanthomonadales bacterium]
MLDLAARLVALPAQQLGQLDLPDPIADAANDARRITSHIAHKRQLHYLAKLMRREDDDWIDALRHQLVHDRADARRETARLHRLEHWRDRLLEDGDDALGELAELCPDIDRHHVRQLVRSAREERLANQSPRAFRELFRLLRDHLGED